MAVCDGVPCGRNEIAKWQVSARDMVANESRRAASVEPTSKR